MTEDHLAIAFALLTAFTFGVYVGAFLVRLRKG